MSNVKPPFCNNVLRCQHGQFIKTYKCTKSTSVCCGRYFISVGLKSMEVCEYEWRGSIAMFVLTRFRHGHLYTINKTN